MSRLGTGLAVPFNFRRTVTAAGSLALTGVADYYYGRQIWPYSCRTVPAATKQLPSIRVQLHSIGAAARVERTPQVLIHLLQAYRNAAAQAQATRTEVTPKESIAVVQCLLHVVRTHSAACCTHNASLHSI